LSASITVATAEEIKLLFLEFQSAGAVFFQTLKEQPWEFHRQRYRWESAAVRRTNKLTETTPKCTDIVGDHSKVASAKLNSSPIELSATPRYRLIPIEFP
jgi:hypothetical protein